MSGNVGRNLLIAAGSVILATVAAAVWVMGGPRSQRELRMDQRRIEQLQRIEVFIADYHREHGSLPASLQQLASRPGAALDTTDPVSGQAYDYAVDGARGYRLCAVFQTDTAREDRGAPVAARWVHPRGGHCFPLDVEAQGSAKPAPQLR